MIYSFLLVCYLYTFVTQSEVFLWWRLHLFVCQFFVIYITTCNAFYRRKFPSLLDNPSYHSGGIHIVFFCSSLLHWCCKRVWTMGTFNTYFPFYMRDAFKRNFLSKVAWEMRLNNPFSIFLEIINAYEKSKSCSFETHLKETLSRIYRNFLQKKY